MKFSDITGHNAIIKELREMADTGKLASSILLSGKPGIGKLRVASAFAGYLQCTNKEGGDSCGNCPSCLQNKSLSNPDTHYIYPVVKKENMTLSKDFLPLWKEMWEEVSYIVPQTWMEYLKAGNSQPSIRVTESDDLIFRATLSTYREKYKIFIIWQPEKLGAEAANKLLKVLEEPFEDTVFILVSEEPENILPTIMSRLRHFRMSPLSKEDIRIALEKEGIQGADISEITEACEGSMKNALDLAETPDEQQTFFVYFKEMMRAAYGLQGGKIKDLSEELAGLGREKLIRYLKYVSKMLRENFINNIQLTALNTMIKQEKDFSKNFSPFIHVGNIEGLFNETDRAIRDIERNGNTKIIMFDYIFLVAKWLKVKK